MGKVKIDKALLQRAAELAKELGYSSVDELVEHLIEKALRSRAQDGDSDKDKDKVEQRLRGLGYID